MFVTKCVSYEFGGIPVRVLHLGVQCSASEDLFFRDQLPVKNKKYKAACILTGADFQAMLYTTVWHSGV